MENRIIIENVLPSPRNLSYSSKGVVSSSAKISCSVYTHGTDLVTGIVEYRNSDSADPRSVPLTGSGNDFFTAFIPLERSGILEYRIIAWIDLFSNWIQKIRAWREAGEDVSADIESGAQIVNEAVERTDGEEGKNL